jgi:hypothetical protein
MHNESMAEKANPLGGYEGEIASSNGNKPALGVEVTMSPLVTKVAISAVSLLAGAFIAKKLNARSIAVNTAQKVQDVAEQAEEAATRG